MPAPAPPDDVLRAFLGGALPADRADEVRQWLESDPDGADRLARLRVGDAFLDAMADRTPYPSVSADAVERIVRCLSDARRAGTETPAIADDRTVPRLPTVPPPPAPAPAPPSVTLPAWVPPRLGQFRVVRELGHGGMGYVFEAHDEALDRPVAVKVLAPELARSPEAAARFLREARSAAAVAHDNVVPVLHVGTDAGAPFIVMPLLQGESLYDRLKRSVALAPEEVARIGRDVAAGLSAAHTKGLVHRDLKPANVWLDAGTGRARVLDFGLARHDDGSDALTHPGALAGTPAFMAPELLDGRPATPRSDLFALGAVLYECATGRRAFDGPTVPAVMKAVSEHEPPTPAAVNPAVPAGLSDLVVRLLAKNPDARPASAADVLAALAGAAVAPALGSQPTATWTAAPARARPRQIQIGCVITVSLCLLVGIGLVAVQVRDRDRYLAQQPDQSVKQDSKVSRGGFGGTDKKPTPDKEKLNFPPPTPREKYRGKVDVLLARAKSDTLSRLNVAGALPMRASDRFRIEAEVNPPAYLYLIWVDPDRDVTPVYPWNAKEGWGSRPAKEEPQSSLKLPLDPGKMYTATMAKPGVATMVLFACDKPLAASDAEVERWFKELPDLPLPNNRDDGVMWFDNYTQTTDPLRGKFGEVDADAFGQWQGQLKKSLGGREVFQTAVSFARTGNK